MRSPFISLHLQNRKFLFHIKQAQQAGYPLGNNRCPGCSRHTHFQDNNGKQIQDNVHDRGDQ